MTDRQISVADKSRLVEALLQLDAVSDLNSRNLYVSELEYELRRSLNIKSLNVRRHPDAKHDTWAIVTACLMHPGALDIFAEIMRSLHGGHHAMIEVDRLITTISQDAHPAPDERATLIGVMNGTPPHQLAAAYLAVPNLPDLPPPDWSDSQGIVAQVESISTVRGAAPSLLFFAELLAHAGPANARQRQLHSWVDEVGIRRGVSAATLRELCRQVRQSLVPDVPDEDEDGDATDALTSSTTTPDPAESAEGESETMRTVTVVSKTVSETVDLPRIWGGVPFRNPNFTGREELLQQLTAELAQHTKTSVLPQTLHGFGGVGKTQLAIEYAYRHAEQYNLVWWISAERQTDVLASLAELSDRLGLPTGQDRQQTARAVLDALATSRYTWLLVYDNANRPDDLAQLVPSSGGHVLLTSRNAEWTAQWHSIEVDVFERGESIELLRKRDTDLETADADKLAEKLGDLPLALEQAANFQKATGMPTDEYLRLFDERVELLNEGKPPEAVASFETYVKLAPEGQYSTQAKGMIAQLKKS